MIKKRYTLRGISKNTGNVLVLTDVRLLGETDYISVFAFDNAAVYILDDSNLYEHVSGGNHRLLATNARMIKQ